MTRGRHLDRCRGVTLTEMVVAVALLAIGMVATGSVLSRSDAFVESATAIVVADEAGRRGLASVTDLLMEAKIAHVDTAMRVHMAVSAYDYQSDRFALTGTGLRQCLSPVCAAHTRPDLTTRFAEYVCGREHRVGLAITPTMRGRIWPAAAGSCGLDGSALGSSVVVDGLKLFTARTPDGQFTTAGGAGMDPDWTGLVLIFPAPSATGGLELRRYDLHVADVMAGTVSWSAGWSRWDPDDPSMIDFFDFGTDGTLDASPDGSVPATAAASDAATELFVTGLYSGEPAVVISKTIGSTALPPRRELSLIVRLRDGWTSFYVIHQETDGKSWTASRSFTRTPRTLVPDLTEFAASTRSTNPFDAANNPTGIEDPGVVRLTVGTTRAIEEKGRTRWVNHVETLEIGPRN